MHAYGLDDRCVVLLHDMARPESESWSDVVPVGPAADRAHWFCREADLLWNFACAIPPGLVHLPMWPVQTSDRLDAPFTSVTQWNWGELRIGNALFSVSKREAYLRHADLPHRAGRPFLLAANSIARGVGTKTGE